MSSGDEGRFWTWFSKARSQFAAPEFPAELGRRLASVGIDRWEAGPLDAEGTKMFLAFSPSDKDDIARLQDMVARAPTFAGWEVRVGKPRKFWDRIFLWSDAEIEIDANGWRCVVLRYDDGLYEIVVLDPAIPPALVHQTQAIIEFVIESELGEVRVLEKICGVSAEPPSDSAPWDAAIAIEALDRCVA